SCLIRPGLGAPPVVCAAFYYPERGEPELYCTADLWRPLLALLEDRRRLIVLHNGGFDMCCALEWAPASIRARVRRAVFRAYDDDRILDTMLAQRLVEIETGDKRGKLALDMLCRRYGLDVSKEEAEADGRVVRYSYGRYLNRPLSDYTPKAIAYAKGDPLVTWKLFERILSRGLVSRRALAKMTRTDLALKLVACVGLAADPERVTRLEETARARIAELQEIMLRAGAPKLKRVVDEAGARFEPVLDADGRPVIERFMRWERGK